MPSARSISTFATVNNCRMKLSTQILLAFAVVLVLSIIDTASNYVVSLKVEENMEFVSNSQSVIRNSTKLHKGIIEMQNSFMSYLLTGDSSYKSQMQRALDSLPGLSLELKTLTVKDTQQQLILDSIRILYSQWVSNIDTVVHAFDNHTVSSYNRTAFGLYSPMKRINKNLDADLSRKFQEFDRLEYKHRSIHGSLLILSIQRTHIFSLVFFALTLVIGVSTMAYVLYILSRRIKVMVGFAQTIAQGNFASMEDNSNDELKPLSVSLNLMSASLKKNIDELERRNAELDKFVYVVSHDLKAPLRGIHNIVKWIEEDLSAELSEQMIKYLEVIVERIKRMEDLINGLLEYTKTNKKTEHQHVDVSALVKRIADDIVPRELNVHIGKLPVIEGEQLRLEQVFTNLISNAVKYGKASGGNITIEAKDLGKYVEFHVKDDGPGIEEEYHEKIFEMFQTLREKNEKESTGIGLAITKKIIDEQGGSILVRSIPGHGADFVFKWPKHKIQMI